MVMICGGELTLDSGFQTYHIGPFGVSGVFEDARRLTNLKIGGSSRATKERIDIAYKYLIIALKEIEDNHRYIFTFKIQKNYWRRKS